MSARRNRLILELAQQHTGHGANKRIAAALAAEYPDITPAFVAGVKTRARQRAVAALAPKPPRTASVARGPRPKLETIHAARARAREVGVSDTAREFGVPRKTVQRWRAKYGV